MGPEQQRLMDRLFNDPTRKLVNFKMSRGDILATKEQICAEVNKAMDQVERRRAAGDLGDGPARTEKPSVNILQLVSEFV